MLPPKPIPKPLGPPPGSSLRLEWTPTAKKMMRAFRGEGRAPRSTEAAHHKLKDKCHEHCEWRDQLFADETPIPIRMTRRRMGEGHASAPRTQPSSTTAHRPAHRRSRWREDHRPWLSCRGPAAGGRAKLSRESRGIGLKSSLLTNSFIETQSPMVVEFTLEGAPYMPLDGGPMFTHRARGAAFTHRGAA